MSTTDNGHDIELGVPETQERLPRVPKMPSSDILVVQRSLRDLQVELNEFLAAHTEKILSLQTSMPSAEQQAAQANLNTRLSVQYTDPPSPTSQVSEKPQQTAQSQSPRSSIPDTMKAVDAHVDHLKVFLSSHIHNIRSLHDALPTYPTVLETPQRLPMKDAKSSEPDKKKAYQSLSEQFSMLVVISTFTASLIVAFLSLVKSIVLDNHRVAFDVGMLLAFFAMSLHFGNIIVAGRGSALTSQYSAAADNDYDLAYFQLYLKLCEQLQFIATILFIVAIVQLTFVIFSEIKYPLVLLGVACFGGLIVFWSVYWRVSITFRNLKFFVKSVRNLRSRLSHRFAS